MVMRIAVAALTILLVSACFHDDASPFVHGAKNKPGVGMTSTWVPRAPAPTDTTGTESYGASSGYGGGVEKERAIPAQPGGMTSSPAATPMAGTPAETANPPAPRG